MTHSNNPYSGYEQAVPNALNNPSANAIHMLAPRTFVRTKENLLGAVQEAMQQAPMPAFDAVTVAFLIDFSKRLLSESEPELKALGFWLRKSQISKWQNEYTHVSQKESEHSTILRFPIGSVLHFTPANVDTMFVYSWICALVLGNISVLRLSRQESQIKQRLLQMINDLYAIPDYQEIARRNLFITYEHAFAITQSLSVFADARILWGGGPSR